MHTSIWGFTFAIAVGGMSQFIKDVWPDAPAWLVPMMFYLSAALAVASVIMYLREWRFSRKAAALSYDSESISVTSKDQTGGITSYIVNHQKGEAVMSSGLRRVLATTRDLENARAALDMLAHRLRDDGPSMTREQIRERVMYAAEKINNVVPRSMLRGRKLGDG